MIKLQEILKEIRKSEDYLSQDNSIDQNLFETYVMLGELLNPNNAYEYTGNRELFNYKDINENVYFVRLTYIPTKNSYFELKTGWYDDAGIPNYDPPLHPNSTAKDWDKRSDTVAKIFRDELLPFFMLNAKELNCDTIKIFPISLSRYQFSIRLVNKFVNKEKFNIIENKPKSISLILFNDDLK